MNRVGGFAFMATAFLRCSPTRALFCLAWNNNRPTPLAQYPCCSREIDERITAASIIPPSSSSSSSSPSPSHFRSSYSFRARSDRKSRRLGEIGLVGRSMSVIGGGDGDSVPSSSSASAPAPDDPMVVVPPSAIRKKLVVLGVCGGIASGKSRACEMMASHPDLGCVGHIDADKLAHVVYAPGSAAIDEIAAEFGRGVLAKKEGEGQEERAVLEIDRKKLGEIVFSDRSRMAALERIVWPHVRSELERKLAKLEGELSRPEGGGETQRGSKTPVAIVEAAMMIESGWDDMFDALWVVRTPRRTAHDRLVTDRGLDPGDASLRIDAQLTRRGIGNLDKEVAAQPGGGVVTAVIENDGDLDQLASRLEAAWTDPSCWKGGRALGKISTMEGKGSDGNEERREQHANL